eukprot:sb/3464874/
MSSEEKKMWTQRAKEEHARNQGSVASGHGSGGEMRMDCNRRFISQRQAAEQAELDQREEERRYCKGVLERNGHTHSAISKADLEHEIPPVGFTCATKDYDRETSKLHDLMRLDRPMRPLVFCRSSERKRAEGCFEWFHHRVERNMRINVMELEMWMDQMVAATGSHKTHNTAQLRRLLYETRYDFARGVRCEFHCSTDKISCAIGNTRKWFFFIVELMFDFVDNFTTLPGKHHPRDMPLFQKESTNQPAVQPPPSNYYGDGHSTISSYTSLSSRGASSSHYTTPAPSSHYAPSTTSTLYDQTCQDEDEVPRRPSHLQLDGGTKPRGRGSSSPLTPTNFSSSPNSFMQNNQYGGMASPSVVNSFASMSIADLNNGGQVYSRVVALRHCLRLDINLLQSDPDLVTSSAGKGVCPLNRSVLNRGPPNRGPTVLES